MLVALRLCWPVSRDKRPVKGLELERLARECIVAHHELKSDLSGAALDSAMDLYSKHFGAHKGLVFMNTVYNEIWNAANTD